MSRQPPRPAQTEPPVSIGPYKLDGVIGQGNRESNEVHMEKYVSPSTTKRTKRFHELIQVAIKVIEKAQIQSPKQIARLQREIRFLKLLHHPNIVKVIDVVETPEFIYIIMEYAVGGELFDYIVTNKRVKEKEARSFFRMVLSAVDYCHQNAIIHRDLKPENLLLDDKKNIKIIDFGFGNNFKVNSFLDTFCGSPFYAAPEMILGKKYEGPEVDMWSLGVILFALLCGHLPFDDDNMKELYKKIANGSYHCPDYLPFHAKHLIDRLITVDPKKRATLPEVMSHPWVMEGYDQPPPNYLPERPLINNPKQLSKDITNRLEIFGYTMPDIIDAFSPHQDFSKPNPIRATYHLLTEMISREQIRLRALRNAKKSKIASSANTLVPGDDQNNSASITDLEVRSSLSLQQESHKEIPKRVPQSRAVSYNDPNKQILAIQNLVLDDKKRRQSVPLMIPNTHTKPPSTTEKFKEELRAVSGWFLNFSSTTTKSATEIMTQIRSILGENFIAFSSENRYIVQSEVDVHCNDWSVPVDVNKKHLVAFQIEICQIPRMDLHAIHFKRISGGVWNYKKVCNRILAQMQL